MLKQRKSFRHPAWFCSRTARNLPLKVCVLVKFIMFSDVNIIWYVVSVCNYRSILRETWGEIFLHDFYDAKASTVKVESSVKGTLCGVLQTLVQVQLESTFTLDFSSVRNHVRHFLYTNVESIWFHFNNSPTRSQVFFKNATFIHWFSVCKRLEYLIYEGHAIVKLCNVLANNGGVNWDYQNCTCLCLTEFREIFWDYSGYLATLPTSKSSFK